MGTKILTDGWAGYKQLEKLGNIFWIFVFLFIIEISGYFWDFVNHSENFRKPEDHSVHTNTIEGSFLDVVKSFDVFKPNLRKVVRNREEFAKKWSLRLTKVLFICR